MMEGETAALSSMPEHVRKLVGADVFVEVFVDTPLEDCIARDPKGLYKRALAGEIKNFTGISQAYEAPAKAELHLHTHGRTPEALALEVIDALSQRGVITRL